MADYFDSYTFSGSYLEIGRQYGEAIREKLRRVYEENLEKLTCQDGIPEERLREIVHSYYCLCEPYAPQLLDQLKGEGESSGIGDFGAMLVNVSREIGAIHANRFMECTSYAVGGSYTADGKHYSGQNQDMKNGYEENCDIVTFAVPGKPKVMFMLPAGNLAFSGMNSEGISCNRNFLFGSAWKFALPRYFVTRLALESRSLEEVKAVMDKMDYPSSHHSLYADRHGRILSYELDAKGFSSAWFQDCFVHTNHFLLPDMMQYERRTKAERYNSETRLRFLKDGFEKQKGCVDIAFIQSQLCSHENRPDSICVHDHHGSSTIASTINCLDDGKMLVSKGNPCINGYREYRF